MLSVFKDNGSFESGGKFEVLNIDTPKNVYLFNPSVRPFYVDGILYNNELYSNWNMLCKKIEFPDTELQKFSAVSGCMYDYKNNSWRVEYNMITNSTCSIYLYKNTTKLLTIGSYSGSRDSWSMKTLGNIVYAYAQYSTGFHYLEVNIDRELIITNIYITVAGVDHTSYINSSGERVFYSANATTVTTHDSTGIVDTVYDFAVLYPTITISGIHISSDGQYVYICGTDSSDALTYIWKFDNTFTTQLNKVVCSTVGTISANESFIKIGAYKYITLDGDGVWESKIYL